MKVLATIAGLADALEHHRRAGRSIGFVPTMGALHEGHLSLLRGARALDVVVLSIFVNPLQFGPTEDLRSYPRTTKQDLALAESAGVDIVFLPEVEEMYGAANEPVVALTVGRVGELLEGQSRPGHFDGVATVVAKLFNIVRPDEAFFGQKDAQQVAVIRGLISDLSYPVALRVLPTVREEDGLALSSRNAYLSPEQRRRATLLYAALEEGRRVVEEAGDHTLAEKKMVEVLETDPMVETDYARAVNPDTFEAPAPGDQVLLVVAARVGRTRLIDNLLVPPAIEQKGVS
jgi:pantoate--beta-alanine ligase